VEEDAVHDSLSIWPNAEGSHQAEWSHGCELNGCSECRHRGARHDESSISPSSRRSLPSVLSRLRSILEGLRASWHFVVAASSRSEHADRVEVTSFYFCA
jgi:hypothetical protein